jgi:hypothetical protein
MGDVPHSGRRPQAQFEIEHGAGAEPVRPIHQFGRAAMRRDEGSPVIAGSSLGAGRLKSTPAWILLAKHSHC